LERPGNEVGLSQVDGEVTMLSSRARVRTVEREKGVDEWSSGPCSRTS